MFTMYCICIGHWIYTCIVKKKSGFIPAIPIRNTALFPLKNI